MLTVRLSNNHTCIFDEGTITHNLTVRVAPDGYKSIIYSSGEHRKKIFARVLMNIPKDLLADHKNGNSLDCRRCNIRSATRQQNMFNKKAARKTKLPKGVFKQANHYTARLGYNGIRYNLGTYLTPELAEEAYINKAIEVQGEYAVHERTLSNE